MRSSRKIIYLILGKIDNLLGRKNFISILSYHSVYNDGWRFSINPEIIKKQINYISENYDLITLGDLEQYLAGKKEIKKPSFILTFDDGYRDILEIKSYLVKKNIRPSLFILSDPENANYKELDTKRDFLKPKEIKQLINLGWKIGCHSATHANLTKLGDTDLEKEIIHAKHKLEKDIQVPIKYFAYPKGKYSPKVINAIKKANYSLAFSMDDGFINLTVNRMLIPRIGVDRTHSFSEFKVLFSPSVIIFRKIVKKMIWRYL